MIRTVGFIALIGVVGLACAEPNTPIDASATDSFAVVSLSETSPGACPQVVVTRPDPFYDFGVTTNDVVATIVEAPVWLVNESPQPLIVTAWGGAESVVVDTVAAADSAFVRISTRALTLELSARTSDGVAMGTVALPMDSRPRRAAFPH
jgi:hypothetical protein